MHWIQLRATKHTNSSTHKNSSNSLIVRVASIWWLYYNYSPILNSLDALMKVVCPFFMSAQSHACIPQWNAWLIIQTKFTLFKKMRPIFCGGWITETQQHFDGLHGIDIYIYMHDTAPEWRGSKYNKIMSYIIWDHERKMRESQFNW